MADITEYLVGPVLIHQYQCPVLLWSRNAPACLTLRAIFVSTEAPGNPQTFHVTSTQTVAYMEVCVRNSNKEIKTIILYTNQVEYIVSRPIAYCVIIKTSSGTRTRKIVSVLFLTLCPKMGTLIIFRRELQNNFICDLPWNHFHVEYQGCYDYNWKGQNTCVKILFCVVYRCHVRHCPLRDVLRIGFILIFRCFLLSE
jgi:hypothetical protein